MAVHYRQKEEVALLQVMFDSIDYLRAVVIADLRRDHADRERSLEPQRAGKKVGSVIELARRLQNALLGVFRYGAGRRRVVQSR